MPENYGHTGRDLLSGQSGFHWGTGSALTTSIIFKEKLGSGDFDMKALNPKK